MFLRRWFCAKGFTEVQPAALQVSPGNETHLHGFRTELNLPDGSPHDAYLHTSPEFAMKKLLTAGEQKIFSLTGVFRNRQRTALHAPEFAMLEWYRAHTSIERVMEDCAAVIGPPDARLAAARLNPKSPEVFRGYAQLELRRGNDEEWKAWKAKSRFPPFPLVLEIPAEFPHSHRFNCEIAISNCSPRACNGCFGFTA